MGFSRTDCNFVSHGDNCSAWLYMPEGAAKPPLIVMAHGFGGLKNCGLEPFAELFANNGFAVLLFDYRGFGGKPRKPEAIDLAAEAHRGLSCRSKMGAGT